MLLRSNIRSVPWQTHPTRCRRRLGIRGFVLQTHKLQVGKFGILMMASLLLLVVLTRMLIIMMSVLMKMMEVALDIQIMVHIRLVLMESMTILA